MNPFSHRAREYDGWFELNNHLYEAELKAIESHLPGDRFFGLEVGVGTGRFASLLGFKVGVDPSISMLQLAHQRGVVPVVGAGEELPFLTRSFDVVLLVTVLCFCQSPLRVLAESKRVLKAGGRLIAAIIDADSPLGVFYQAKKAKSPFYRYARFLGARELKQMLESTGFGSLRFSQTLFGNSMENLSTEVREGFGEGGFVVASGTNG